MKIYKYFLLLIAILLTSAITKAQDSTRVIKFNQTNIGIPITKSEFDRKISNYVKLMSDWTTFKPEEYIDMVRAYNTIGGSLPINNDFYKTYYTVFLIMYSKLAAKSLDAELRKGMAMYSEKYKIWIGDVPLGNDNSRFKIDTAK
ncbi:hypothetical protein G7092_06715 [Mucilaginibacter sp. HC2]|uniref:hypothetical protein n=1 Tax=Mucilaginibacter inviolabilis TaxID=2714892 RepID=UPI00140A8637|nr:hypothetical protein [Mucilaginibacter inviolabilis]NHA03476.1 hypothetical protein [Mucilaginibacter inviolabilis]